MLYSPPPVLPVIKPGVDNEMSAELMEATSAEVSTEAVVGALM